MPELLRVRVTCGNLTESLDPFKSLMNAPANDCELERLMFGVPSVLRVTTCPDSVRCVSVATWCRGESLEGAVGSLACFFRAVLLFCRVWTSLDSCSLFLECVRLKAPWISAINPEWLSPISCSLFLVIRVRSQNNGLHTHTHTHTHTHYTHTHRHRHGRTFPHS